MNLDQFFQIFSSNMTDDTRSVLIKKSTLHHLNKNEFVWKINDPAENILFIVSGHAEVSNMSFSNQHNILGIIGPGDCIGTPGVFGQDGRYVMNIKALEGGIDYYLIPLKQILSETENSKEVFKLIYDLQLKHEELLQEKIEVLSSGDLEYGIKNLLKKLCLKFATKVENDRYTLPFTLTRQQFAQYLGGRQETIIRLMSKWTKNNLIEKKNNLLHVHFDLFR